jgi:hypothetical protein
MPTPLPFLKPFYLDDVGVPLALGKLYTYENNTVTDKPTWKDPLGAELNTNPIILDPAGKFDCFLGAGLYTIKLTNALDAIEWEKDDISGTGTDQLQVVETIADLKALPSGSTPWAIVMGYNSIGDGGGGIFIFDDAISTTEDGGVTFTPDDAPAVGRWVRFLKDEISVRYFGAIGDGVTDDKLSFEKAIAYVKAAGHTGYLYVPASPTGLAYRLVTNPTGLDTGDFTLRVEDGALLDFDVIPTIKCNFQAGPYRILAAGSFDPLFDFGCTFEQGPYPEWWGAVNDGTGDQLTAIDSWLSCGAPLLFTSGGTYAVSAPPTFPVNVTILSGGMVKQGVTEHIGVGVHLTSGAVIRFAEILGGDIIADTITGDLVQSTDNVQAADDVIAGSDAAGSLIARASTGTKQFKAGGLLYSKYELKTGSGAADDLQSYTLPANSLDLGDVLKIKAAGYETSTTPDTYRLKALFGGIGIFDTGDLVGVGDSWEIEIWAVIADITGSDYLVGFARLLSQRDAAGSVVITNTGALGIVLGNGPIDRTIANIIKFTGETSNAAKQVVQATMTIEYQPKQI